MDRNTAPLTPAADASSIARAASILPGLTADLKADNDTATRIAATAKEYAQFCFRGECDEWPQMLEADVIRGALNELQKAVYRDPETALLDVQLVLTRLICEAGKAHAETIERNKANAEKALRERDEELRYEIENGTGRREHFISCGCGVVHGQNKPCVEHAGLADFLRERAIAERSAS